MTWAGRRRGRGAGARWGVKANGHAAKPNKFSAEPMLVDGHVFASKREGRRFQALCVLRAAHLIADLRLQVEFPITAVNLETGELVNCGRYVADFTYIESGQLVVEDSKGFRTPVYRLKKRLVEAQYGIRIRET